MKRRLFNVVAAVSLVMCIVTPAAWLRSHWVCDQIGVEWHRQSDESIPTSITIGLIHGGGDFGLMCVTSTPSTDTRRWVYLGGPPLPLHTSLAQAGLGVGGYGWYSQTIDIYPLMVQDRSLCVQKGSCFRIGFSW